MENTEVLKKGEAGEEVPAPTDLYALLGVSPDATDEELKKAYYGKMKVCHPDVAGDEGQEMCILLNETYEMLNDPRGRAQYDEQVRATQGGAIQRYKPADPDDLGPTWTWQPKRSNREKPPEYVGTPFSRSAHDKVPPDARGRRWGQEQFVFVDEWTCIACRNCCDVAPKTFCIDMDAGRARAYAQWGDTEEDLEYAVSACPVDCIYWVGREELQVLEYVTRDRLHALGNQLPCPMASRQGAAPVEDPFELAAQYQRKVEAAARKAEQVPNVSSELLRSATRVRERIAEAFEGLNAALKLRGWGGW